MEVKKLDKKGVDFLVGEEGCVLHPYLDSVGICTISCGCTYWESGKRICMEDKPITMARAVLLFKHLLKHYETAVWSLTRDDITQNNFNALVSFSYNVGVNALKTSTLLKRVNKNPHDLGITSSFYSWRFAGGKPILGPRRIRECNLYFT